MLRSGLTQRAADKWESARFSGIFNALAESRFRALSASHPLAAIHYRTKLVADLW